MFGNMKLRWGDSPLLLANSIVTNIDYNTGHITLREAKQDMSNMLEYVSKLNELDTDSVEPMSHAFPVSNVFREDVVTNGDDRDNLLANAPEQKDGCYKVPKTFD